MGRRFHHVVRVQMTGEKEGYLGYFKGRPEELLRTMREGWLFTGQIQKDGIAAGNPRLQISSHSILCIAFRTTIRWAIERLGIGYTKLLAGRLIVQRPALLLLSPYTPMLFMGQEWGCSSPFNYFTDHEPQLGHNVTEGRRKEFEQFSAFRDPGKPAEDS